MSLVGASEAVEFMSHSFQFVSLAVSLYADKFKLSEMSARSGMNLLGKVVIAGVE